MAEEDSTQGGEHAASEGTERVREVIRDGFYTMLGAASWAFEKTDEMTHNWLHQGRVSGEQSRLRFGEFAARTVQAGESLGNRVQQTLRGVGSSVPLATRDQVANLERRIEELSKQIESMRGSSGETN
jgi:polyhydroxyalkanoate synthesis regulator phasin